MHGAGTLESRLVRLPLPQLLELARRNGINTRFRRVPGTGGRKVQQHSRVWLSERLAELARTGRDLGLPG